MKIILCLCLLTASLAWSAEGKKKLAPRAEVILSDDNKHIDGKTPDEKNPEKNTSQNTNVPVREELKKKKDARQ